MIRILFFHAWLNGVDNVLNKRSSDNRSIKEVKMPISLKFPQKFSECMFIAIYVI